MRRRRSSVVEGGAGQSVPCERPSGCGAAGRAGAFVVVVMEGPSALGPIKEETGDVGSARGTRAADAARREVPAVRSVPGPPRALTGGPLPARPGGRPGRAGYFFAV